MGKETSRTGPQLHHDSVHRFRYGYEFIDDSLTNYNDEDWPRRMRKMRRDPTIKLVRLACVAPAMMTTWAVESDSDVPDEVTKQVEEDFKHHRSHLIQTGLNGMIDWGWQGYEKLFELYKGRIRFKRFKPLLQDMTEITIFKSGEFSGFVQGKNCIAREARVDLDCALLFNTNVEGTNHDGEADMRSAEEAYLDKRLVNQAATRYDQKIAGAHWIVHYPLGKSPRGDTMVDNYEIAMEILSALESSGRMAIPRKLSGQINGLNSKTARDYDAWEIELKSANGSQVPFNERMMYLDNLLVRAFGFPERAILQGQFGTKAEAGEHGTFAIVNVQLRHEILVQQLNWHAVNQYITLNYGQNTYQNKVRIAPAPLADFQKTMLKELYTAILKDPRGFLAEASNIDMSAIRDKLEIPAVDNASDLDVEKAVQLLISSTNTNLKGDD